MRSLAHRTKGGEIRDAKALNLLRNIVSSQVLGRRFAFFTLRDQLVAQQKYFCCGLKKVEQQILALLLVFYHTRNLSWIYTRARLFEKWITLSTG